VLPEDHHEEAGSWLVNAPVVKQRWSWGRHRGRI